MLKTQIQDGGGSGERASVVDNALLVLQQPYPPIGVSKMYVFRRKFSLDGTATGTSDMRVLGTLAAPVKFYIPADLPDDRYITMLSFMIAGASCTLSEFSTVPALTNGCRLYYEQPSGIKIIHDSLKTNWDFIRLCGGQPAFGSGADAFRATNVVGASEAYIPTLDLTKIMPLGVKLDKGTNQRLVLEVRDDLTAVAITGFDCIAYGFDRVP